MSGIYQVVGEVNISTSTLINLDMYKNGSNYQRVMQGQSSTTSYNFIGYASLIAGDTLSIRSSVTATLSNSSTVHFISITKVSGLAAIGTNETVAFSAYGGPAAGLTATPTVMTATTKDFDTHGGYSASTGLYTVPTPGKYQCSCRLTADSATTSNQTNLQWYINGSSIGISYGSSGNGTVATEPMANVVNSVLNLQSGQTLGCYAFLSSGTSSAVGSAAFSCARVGP
jgi:hypothetical protein